VIPAMLTSGLLAVSIERVAYRPLRKRGAPRLAYLISAIGMSLFLQYTVQVWRGVNPEAFPSTLKPTAWLHLGGVDVFNTDVIVIISGSPMWVAGTTNLLKLHRIGERR